jgi:DNA-binding NarL/FixJ family response regulator
MQTQIKNMSEQGHPIRTIARVLKLSRRTVRLSEKIVEVFNDDEQALAAHSR